MAPPTTRRASEHKKGERGDDTIVLAQHFLLLLNQANASQKGFSSPAMQILRGYSWPGNVRELKNLVRRAFILFDETLEVDTLLSKTGACAAPADDYLRIPMGIPLAEAERHFISATLDRHAGNKKKAADALGLSLKTLYNRLNVWGRADKSCISHKFR